MTPAQKSGAGIIIYVTCFSASDGFGDMESEFSRNDYGLSVSTISNFTIRIGCIIGESALFTLILFGFVASLRVRSSAFIIIKAI